MTDDPTQPPHDPDADRLDPDRPDPADLARLFVTQVENFAKAVAPRPPIDPAQLAADAMALAEEFLNLGDLDQVRQMVAIADSHGHPEAGTLSEYITLIQAEVIEQGLDQQPELTARQRVQRAAETAAERMIATAHAEAEAIITVAQSEADDITARAQSPLWTPPVRSARLWTPPRPTASPPSPESPHTT